MSALWSGQNEGLQFLSTGDLSHNLTYGPLMLGTHQLWAAMGTQRWRPRPAGCRARIHTVGAEQRDGTAGCVGPLRIGGHSGKLHKGGDTAGVICLLIRMMALVGDRMMQSLSALSFVSPRTHRCKRLQEPVCRRGQGAHTTQNRHLPKR